MNQNVQFQKISILSHRKDLEFPAGRGSVRPKHLKKCMKHNWNFQRGGGLRKSLPWAEVWIFSGTTQYVFCEIVLEHRVSYVTH